jgi:hypothetical protein
VRADQWGGLAKTAVETRPGECSHRRVRLATLRGPCTDKGWTVLPRRVVPECFMCPVPIPTWSGFAVDKGRHPIQDQIKAKL